MCTSYTLALIAEHTRFHSRLIFESDALIIEIVEAVNNNHILDVAIVTFRIGSAH